MTVMPAPSQHQWYLARDGQQYGPLSDPELAKFVELGHLQPNDLLWREGFSDWRPALTVFPPKTGAAAAGRQASAAAADLGKPPSAAAVIAKPELEAARPGDDAAASLADAEQSRGRRMPGGRRLKALLGLALLLVVVWFAYVWRADLTRRLGAMSFGSVGSVAATDRNGIEVPPLKGFAPNAGETDANLQATPLWRILKREFPDWYAERLKEVQALVAQNKDQAAIAQQLGQTLVTLRRQQTEHALSASLPRLKQIATTFYENIAELRKDSTDACFAFISQGEASPAIVALLQGGSPHTARLQSQLVSVFEAVADGRKVPRVYPKPRKTDYETLATALTGLGWSQADMQLFSDERELARAAPDKICQLVHDWFAAQLALKDSDVQLRLLVDSLRPVVAG